MRPDHMPQPSDSPHPVDLPQPVDMPQLSGALPRPGDVVVTTVTRAAPHYLIADGAPLAVRRTRGGDAWEIRRQGTVGQAATQLVTGNGAVAGDVVGGQRVMLGMPALSRPA